MQISYDAASDVLRICFQAGESNPQDVGEGVSVCRDAQGRLTSLEIRRARKQLGDLSMLHPVLLEHLGPPVAEGCPPSTIVANHIVLDERGRAYVDDTNVKVIEVVLDKIGQGLSPEEMQTAHPGMFTPGQLHAALAYYYDHQAEFDAEIKRQHEGFVMKWRFDTECAALPPARGVKAPHLPNIRGP